MRSELKSKLLNTLASLNKHLLLMVSEQQNRFKYQLSDRNCALRLQTKKRIILIKSHQTRPEQY